MELSNRRKRSRGKGGAKKTKSLEVQLAQLKAARRASVVKVIGNALQKLIPWGFATLMVYFAATTIVKVTPDLAGKDTGVDVGLVAIVSGVAEIFARNEWPWGILAVVILADRIYIRYLKRQIADLSKSNKRLERKLDPDRTSSGMTEMGKEPKS